MGGSTSEPQFNQLSSYKVIQKYPQFNVTHLSHMQTDRQYVLRQLTYNDQGLYKKSFTEHKQRQTISDDHLTHLVRVYEKEVDHLCSNLYKIYAIWQYPYRFLNDQINQRSYQHRKFQEKQIWSILASAILGLSTLQKNKIKHEMLSTKTILLDSDGIIKIADPLACGYTTNLQTVQRNRNSENIYLSPEQCQSLQSRVIYNNAYKSDVWTIGMIILQCGLLNSMSKCYRDEFQRIDYIFLNKKLAEFGQQYGDELKTILENMLRKDHKDRPDWVDLQSYARKSRSTPTYSSANKVIEQSGNKSNLSPLKKQEYSSYMVYTQPEKNRQTYEINTKPLYIPNKQLAPTITNTQLIGTTSNYIPPMSSSIPSNYTPKFTNYLQAPQTKTHNYSTSLHQPSIHFSVGGVNAPNYNPKPASITQQSYASGHNTYSTLPNSHFIYKPPQLPVASQAIYKGFTNNLYGDSKNYDWKKPINYYSLNTATNNTAINHDSLKKDFLGQNQVAAAPVSFTQQSSFTPNNNLSGIGYSNQGLFKQPNFQENLFTPLAQLYPTSGGSSSKQEQKIGSFYQQQPIKNQEIQSSSNWKKQQDRNQLFGNQNRNLQNLSNFLHTTEQNNIPISQTLNKETQHHQSFLNNTTQNDQPVQVVEKFKQGSRYEGYKWKGMRHGQGKFFYQDGGMYDGNWTLNKMDGFGSLYYQSGQLAYQGFWKDDQFQGKGKLFNQYPSELQTSFNYRNFDEIQQFWSYYDGEFVQDFKKGRGILMISNGEYLEGTFDNDMVEGPGQFHCKDGRVIKGVWKQNHLIQR